MRLNTGFGARGMRLLCARGVHIAVSEATRPKLRHEHPQCVSGPGVGSAPQLPLSS